MIGDLIEALQTLSRTKEFESTASSLLKIVHRNLELSKSIIVIIKKEDTKNNFLVAFAENKTNTNNEELSVSFSLESVVDLHRVAPLSLLSYSQRQLAIITEKTNADFEDIYLNQQQPDNFWCFPVVDENQFFGILYLENLYLKSSNDLENKVSTDKFIAAVTALTTQMAIALKDYLQTEKQDAIALQQKCAAVEVTFDGIAILKEEKFVYLNPSHATILGYDNPAELLGQNWRVLYPSEEATRIEQQVFPIFVRQGYWKGECKAKKRDGTFFNQEIALYKLDEREMVCVCRDISDRLRKDELLKETQKRYLLLSATVPVGIFRTDKSGNFSYVNERWCLITGLTPEQAMGKGWFKTIHPHDITSILQQWDEAIYNESSFRAEYRFLTNNNLEIWVFAQAIAEYDSSDRLVGYVGTITDITKLKESQKYLTKQLQREQLLKKITQEIRRSWNISAISQTAASQIGRVFQVSRCLIHSYVVASEPQIPIVAQYIDNDKIIPIDIPIPVENNDYVLKILDRDLAVVSSDVETEPLLSEVQEICKKFKIRSILAVRTSYQGKPNGIVALNQCDYIRQWNIDEVELLEAVAVQMGIAIAQAELLEKEQQQSQELYLNNLALTKAKKDAEVANKAKSQFLAHMSHELRTPLNAILGFSQLMVKDDSLNESQIEQIEIINRSGQHLLNLINNILDLSKIEAGKATIQKDRLDFYDFILGIERMFELQARLKGLKLTVEISSEIPQFVITDEIRLKQILLNLLNNAIKFTNQGEVSLRIKSQNLQSLVFKISDTGTGIAKQDLNRIFEPFEQTYSGIKIGKGTGLGLSICRSLIKLLGGILEVKSQIGQGTTFLFQIPVEMVEVQTKDSLDKTKPIIKIADGQQHRFLVVDDSRDNCTLINNLLTKVGFTVREAYNGQEAIEIYQDWFPEFILMDIHMPIMDGYQATKKIKQQDKLNQTTIIAATASILEEDNAKILAAGCVDVINKPFDIEKLLMAIAKELDNTYSNNWFSKESIPHSSNLKLKQLSSMPQEWLEQLHYATVSASESKINHLINQIPELYNDLSNELQEMVNNFALETIIDRVEDLLEINS